ncbi:MAG: hypothetical protein ACJAUP_000126 [Cellvibrionaceae bacterium]|jgi:hypothetical protein
MNIALPLTSKKKLSVICRVEPGCLGPTGVDHIEQFCHLAEKGVARVDADFVHWHITPRYNKSLCEMNYSVDGKDLSHDKAEKYLQLFQKDLDEFEGHLQENLANMINLYLNRINN